MQEFIIWISGFALGWFASYKFLVRAFHNILQKGGVTEEQLREAARNMDMDEDALFDAMDVERNPEDDINTVHFRLEEHDGSLIAYRLETDEFLAQGNAQGIFDRLTERFPKGTKFMIADEDGADLMRHLQGVDNV